MTSRGSHMDCVAARAPAAAGRWLTHERIATSQPGGEIVCWTMIWSSHDPAYLPEKSHLLSEFTKSKYLLKNTSKTYNLNILRSYNANWTQFWHSHLSIGIFRPNFLFLDLSIQSNFEQTHCVPCTMYSKIWAHFFISSFWRLFSPSSPSSCLLAPSSSSSQLTFVSLSTWPETWNWSLHESKEKWTRMWLFHLRRQDQTSVSFLPVLAPRGEELLSSPDSGKSLPWTPGSPASHCGPGRISGKKKKRSAIVWPQTQKVQQFCNFCICGWPKSAPAPPPMCIAIYSPPFVPHSADHSLHIEDHLRSIRGNALSQPSLQERLRLPAIHLWIAERKVPTSKTKSIVFQLTSSEVVIHRNSFLSINPSKLTSNNLRNIYDLSFWH